MELGAVLQAKDLFVWAKACNLPNRICKLLEEDCVRPRVEFLRVGLSKTLLLVGRPA